MRNAYFLNAFQTIFFGSFLFNILILNLLVVNKILYIYFFQDKDGQYIPIYVQEEHLKKVTSVFKNTINLGKVIPNKWKMHPKVLEICLCDIVFTLLETFIFHNSGYNRYT